MTSVGDDELARDGVACEDHTELTARSVMKITPFRRDLIATALSSYADWLAIAATATFAMVLTAQAATMARAFAFAGALIAHILPATLFGAAAGIVAGRWRSRWLLVGADLLRFALYASIVLLWSLPWLYVAIVLAGCLTLVRNAAHDDAVPGLVGPTHAGIAHRLVLIATYATAPLAALSLWGLTFLPISLSTVVVAVLWFNALTFLVTAAMWLRRRLDTSAGSHLEAGSWGTSAQLRRFLTRQFALRGLLLGTVILAGAAGIFIGVSWQLATDIAGRGTDFAALLGVAGGGAMLSAWLGLWLVSKLSPATVVGIGMVGVAIFGIAAALADTLALALLAAAATGLCFGLSWIGGYAGLASDIDDFRRARAFELLTAVGRVASVIALALSPIISHLFAPYALRIRGAQLHLTSAGWAYWLVGIAVLLTAILVVLLVRRPLNATDADVAGVWSAQSVLTAPPQREHRGWLIAFEGGDGSGKTTQAQLLARWLHEDQGHSVVLTREPGATVIGAQIRSMLLGNQPMSARTEALLFAADRSHHVDAVIRPTLKQNAVVITDRFRDSSVAYQAAGRGQDPEQIAVLSQWASDSLVPDLTIVLDIPTEIMQVRRTIAGQAQDRFEAQEQEFHDRVSAAFTAMAAAQPHRYLVVDGSLTRERVHQLIRQRVREIVPISQRQHSELDQRLQLEAGERQRRADIETEVLQLAEQVKERSREGSGVSATGSGSAAPATASATSDIVATFRERFERGEFGADELKTSSAAGGADGDSDDSAATASIPLLKQPEPANTGTDISDTAEIIAQSVLIRPTPQEESKNQEPAEQSDVAEHPAVNVASNRTVVPEGAAGNEDAAPDYDEHAAQMQIQPVFQPEPTDSGERPTSEPEASEPEASEPEASESEMLQSNLEPEASETEKLESEASKSKPGKPQAEKPENLTLQNEKLNSQPPEPSRQAEKSEPQSDKLESGPQPDEPNPQSVPTKTASLDLSERELDDRLQSVWGEVPGDRPLADATPASAPKSSRSRMLWPFGRKRRQDPDADAAADAESADPPADAEPKAQAGAAAKDDVQHNDADSHP